MGGQSHAPAALPQGQEILYPLYGRHQGKSGRVQKTLAHTEARSPNRPARSESRCRPSLCTTKTHTHTHIYRVYIYIYIYIYIFLMEQIIWRLHHSFNWSNLFRVMIIRNTAPPPKKTVGKVQNLFTPTHTLCFKRLILIYDLQ